MDALRHSEQLGEILGKPLITIVGSSYLKIEGHGGVTEYETSRVTVRCGKFSLRAEGSGLSISSINPDCLSLTGEITSVHFES
ncbi:MAG: YabP/YqfC family sporulation protein [Oscillospiraceae bacterium]|jgi:sporulation protein YqfC|nr:YabP/YqfC family sporulation protein [Oscillospiraceae bacterium]